MSNFGAYGDLSSLFTKLKQRLALRPKTFTGTQDEWDELTVADRQEYEIVNITDDYTPSAGGGHKIEDSEGTELTQRDTLQVGGSLIAEDDTVNEKTIITNGRQTIDYEDWIELTPQEQAAIPEAVIINAPDGGGAGNCLSYNPETDYFGMSYNGIWHDVVYAGFQFNKVVYDSGDVAEYAIPLTISPYSRDASSISATIGTNTINIVSNSNNVDGNYWCALAVITSKIFDIDDLRSAGITKMCASIKSNNSGYTNYGFIDIAPFKENAIEPVDKYFQNTTASVTDTYVTVEYDLSTVVDNFRIGVGYHRGNGSLQQTTYVKKIWFE